MKRLAGLVVAMSLFGGSALADCAVNTCQYGGGCFSDNAIMCQAGQRMQCKAGSWSESAGAEEACSAAFRLITILEMTIDVQIPAVPAQVGVEAVPAKRFQDTLSLQVGALCNFREACSFVPREARGLDVGTFTVTRFRYACRDRATGSVKVFDPKPPNDGAEDVVYNLDCLGS